MAASWARAAFRRTCVLVMVASVLSAGAGRGAWAQIGSERYSSIVVDAASGTVLSSAGADEYRFPASLTKMMTLYMLFEALRDRRVSLYQAVPVSAYAASMSPTKLGLLPGTYITVEQAVLGLVTKSANDAAAALGEMLGGDEDRFAQMMTLRARSLGMARTTFRNASGLPDWEQVSTARDMAILARRLVYDFPIQYRYFSTPSFIWRGRTILNHARMLQTYPGADGLKTGYITASGFNLVTSAVRGDTRLIGVVMGASNSGERDLHMASLLDQGYDRMGVPPMFAYREPPRMPALISAARAAPAAVARSLPVVVRSLPVVVRARSAAKPAARETARVRSAAKPGGRAAPRVVLRAEPDAVRTRPVKATSAAQAPAPATRGAIRPPTLRSNALTPAPGRRIRG